MVEEVHRGSITIPRSVMSAVIVEGLLGFAVVIAIIFAIPDFSAIASTSGTDWTLLQTIVGNTTQVRVLSGFITLTFSAIVTVFLAGFSRLVWSFSYDRGMLGWRGLRQVRPSSLCS